MTFVGNGVCYFGKNTHLRCQQIRMSCGSEQRCFFRTGESLKIESLCKCFCRFLTLFPTIMEVEEGPFGDKPLIFRLAPFSTQPWFPCTKSGSNESPWNPAEISMDFYSAIEANQYFGLHPGDVIFFDQPVRDLKKGTGRGTAGGTKKRRSRISAIPQDRFDFHHGTLRLEIIIYPGKILMTWRCFMVAAGMTFLILEERMTWTARETLSTTKGEKFILFLDHNYSLFDFLLILPANIW